MADEMAIVVSGLAFIRRELMETGMPYVPVFEMDNPHSLPIS
jgi:hypothetical protein